MDRPMRTQRPGFTLVELMVVMALMLVLASLAVLVIPRVSTDQQSTRAAAQLQQWFEIAKQRAARDRAPRGVRLLAGNAANPNFVTDLVFLVQADDYYLGAIQNSVNGSPTTVLLSEATVIGTVVSFRMIDPASGNPSGALPRNLTGDQGSAALYPVLPGDHIVFDGGGPVYEIASVAGLNTLQLKSSAGTLKTTAYRIIRQPRPDGDEPLQMPVNIVIDCTAKGLGYDLPQLSAGVPYLDIMFAPDGRVIGDFAGYDQIIFWVRDATVAPALGDPTLVVIYARTGSVAAQAVDVGNINTSPYTFTKTGVRSAQ